MKKVWAWIKEHPLQVVLILGALLLALLLFGGGSSSNAATAAAGGPSDAAVQAAAALQAQQLQADTANNQISAQLQAQANNNATNLSIAQLQLQGQEYSTGANAQVSLSGIQAQQAVQLAGIQSQTQLADIARQTSQDQLTATVNIAALNAGTYEAITNAQVQEQEAQYAAAVAIQTAPYVAQQSLYTTLGGDNLTKLIYGAEGTKGSTLQLPGVNAGRVGSAGGNLFGNTFAASANPLSSLFAPVGGTSAFSSFSSLLLG